MNTTPINDNGQFENDDSLNLRDELQKYLFHWKWFVFSVFISLSVAFVYKRYASPVYEISSKLLIKEEKGGGSALSAFQDLGMLDIGGYNNIDNEIAILKSRTVAKTVVEDLNLNISYFEKGRVKESEIYKKDNPLDLVVIDRYDLLHQLDTILHI
ncbi:MAG: Wzz/FepE/Etk N-terminal domain-containing protein, partial [Flavicella sp.]